MLSILYSYITQNLFYEIPIPLIIGNLPYGDFLNHLNEYEYLKIYKVPSLNMCLYWSKFHNNYILRKLDNHPEYIFPQLKVKNILYSLNPFMNDLNGICSWINDEINTCSKIYYNTQTSKYEFGFGQDVPTNQGFIYNMIAKDYNFTAYDDVEINDGEFYEQDYNDLAVWKSAQGVKFQYSENLFENITETKVFQIPNKDILTTQENWNTDIQPDKNIIIQDNTYYFRIEDIPDLDGKGICGLYKNSNSDDYYAIGSWVCGVNGNQEFGKFIGVNARYSSSQTYEKNYIGNSYEVVKQQQYTRWDFLKTRRDGKDEYVVLGKTYDLQTPKYLVHWNVKGFEQPYRCNRYFILEDEINPLKARKFWYCDLPNESAEYYSPTRFFRRINW